MPNRALLLLIGSQGVTALAGLTYGKLTALYVSPAVWGDYNLLFVAMTLLSGICVTPTLQAAKSVLGQFAPRSVIAFYSRMLAIIYLVLLVLAVVASLATGQFVFGLIWLAAVSQCILQFGSNYLNAIGRHWRYSLLQLSTNLIGLMSFAGVVILARQRTVLALWLSVAMANVVLALITVQLIRPQYVEPPGAEDKVDPVELHAAYRRYVWPLVSLAFWGWLINYADRYLIRLYLMDADVGQYSMGYSLGSKLLVAVAPLLAFLSPKILRLRTTGQPSVTADHLIRPYLFYYMMAAGIGCLAFYINRDWLGQFLLAERYKPAFQIAPIVATGYLFLTSTHLLELKWYVFGQTKFVLWHNVLGAFLNIGLNALLIPRMGILGSALATLVGFLGQFLMAYGLFTFQKMTDI